MSTHTRLLPAGWPRPKGYSAGVLAEGRMVFVAGLVGWDRDGRFVSDRFAEQVRQTLRNTLDVLAEADAGPEHVVRMTWYVTSRDEYLGCARELGAIWRELMGPHYPVMAVVVVAGLVEPEAKVEIETTAVVPYERGERA